MAVCTVPRIDLARAQSSGQLTIGGLFLHRPAFAVTDCTPLYGPANQRGADKMIPGKNDGVRAKRRRRTGTEYQLPMVLDGRFTPADGATLLAPRANLLDNEEWLQANLVEPTLVGDGTKLASLVMPSGATRSGYVHVVALDVDRRSRTGLALATLTITVPGGRLD